jgi:ribosomal-protein-alanine N-acetyltransferase
MPEEFILETDRLILRPLRQGDTDALAAMNADPEVMRYFPARMDQRGTEALMDRMDRHFARHGFGWWALEKKGDAPFIGFAGLLRPAFQAHFTPCVEVGWRLARAYWGFGYATEAGRASLDVAFERLGLDEVVSMTVTDNRGSRAVMERLGMVRRPRDDFGHPKLPFGHPLREHVLYRLSKESWRLSKESLRQRQGDSR